MTGTKVKCPLFGGSTVMACGWSSRVFTDHLAMLDSNTLTLYAHTDAGVFERK